METKFYLPLVSFFLILHKSPGLQQFKWKHHEMDLPPKKIAKSKLKGK